MTSLAVPIGCTELIMDEAERLNQKLQGAL